MATRPVPDEGPPDSQPEATSFYKITFPADPGMLPVLYHNQDPLKQCTEGLFYSNPDLHHAALHPDSTSKEDLMKVWIVAGLQLGSRDEALIESWPHYEAYRTDIHQRAVLNTRRLAGILVTTVNGTMDHYRVVMAGLEYRTSVLSPEPITELLLSTNIITAGDSVRWSVIIRPQDILFEPNKVFSEWLPLHKAGIQAMNILIPENVLSRIFVRFRLSNRDHLVTAVKLEVEGFIIPRAPTERGKNSMRSDFKHLLDTAAAPSFIFWQHQTTTRWDITYPPLPGKFLTRWPVPAIREINPACTTRPNEFQARRLTHDIFCQASGGHCLPHLESFEEWITDPNRKYYINRTPTLIIPLLNTSPEDVGDSDDFPNPDSQSPSDTGGGQQMTLTPLMAQLLNTWDIREKVASYSGGHLDAMDHKPLPLPERNSETVGSTPLPAINRAPDRRHAEGKHPGLKLQLTAKGKHGANRDKTGLSAKFLEDNPGISQQEADILAAVTQAGISDNTARTHKSMRKMIQNLFPDRPDIFSNNQPGDQLLIISRMLANKYKPKTVLSYISNYDRLVLDAGGTYHPKPPALPKLMTGLRNMDHNPAAHLAAPSRTAYSIHSLQLVAIKGADLMQQAGKWSAFRVALFRATCVLLFFGRLRSAEALMTNHASADILSSLLLKDVVFSQDKSGATSHVTLWLRHAKFQERSVVTTSLFVSPIQMSKFQHRSHGGDPQAPA